MGTSLSFHTRHLYGTNWLVASTLIVFTLSLFNIQQISCQILSSMPEEHNIRHANSHSRMRNSGLNFDVLTLMNSNSRNNERTISDGLESPETNNYYGLFKLRNLCSNRGQGYMIIYNRTLRADAHSSTNTAQFDFQRIPGNEGHFYIRRKNSRMFVCFSRRGKLIVKSKPTDDHRCSFTHTPANLTTSRSRTHSDNQFINIQSVAHKAWYMGFRKNAKPLHGYDYGRRRDKCFIFELSRVVPTSISTENRNPRSLLYQSLLSASLTQVDTNTNAEEIAEDVKR